MNEKVMATILATPEGPKVVVNPGDEDEFTFSMVPGEKRVMGEEDQKGYPWEIILTAVDRPETGTWRGILKELWP